MSARQCKTIFAAAILSCALSLPGCLLYRIDIQQGNEISVQMLDRLTLGMTKREAQKILGTALVTDPFHADRWDYYFYRKRGKTGEVEQHFATLHFENDMLTHVVSSLFPE